MSGLCFKASAAELFDVRKHRTNLSSHRTPNLLVGAQRVFYEDDMGIFSLASQDLSVNSGPVSA